MWVRSQDKETLCECFEVYLEKDESGCYQIINDNDWILGEYTTKEKILRVLDMIERHINGKTNTVFQMPQDREVW